MLVLSSYTEPPAVQFLYGEDGLDVTSTAFLRKFGFQASNADRFAQQLNFDETVAASAALGLVQKEAAVQKEARCTQHHFRINSLQPLARWLAKPVLAYCRWRRSLATTSSACT